MPPLLAFARAMAAAIAVVGAFGVAYIFALILISAARSGPKDDVIKPRRWPDPPEDEK